MTRSLQVMLSEGMVYCYSGTKDQRAPKVPSLSGGYDWPIGPNNSPGVPTAALAAE